MKPVRPGELTFISEDETNVRYTCRSLPTWRVRIYITGPIEVAKQVCRSECLEDGLCVTVEPVSFIYTGAGEDGVRVGLINEPKYPCNPSEITDRARKLAVRMLEAMFQHSVLIQTPEETEWITKRALD